MIGSHVREVRALRRHLRCLHRHLQTLDRAIDLLERAQRAVATRPKRHPTRALRAVVPKDAH